MFGSVKTHNLVGFMYFLDSTAPCGSLPVVGAEGHERQSEHVPEFSA